MVGNITTRQGGRRMSSEGSGAVPSEPSLEQLIGMVRDILPAEFEPGPSVGTEMTLRDMAASDNVDVRVIAAGNPALDPRELARLAGDPVQEVRQAVAGNPATPPDRLTVLARDEGLLVQAAVAMNGATPADSLRELASSDDAGIRELIATNRAAPSDVLARLATDEDNEVRRVAVNNPRSPQGPTEDGAPVDMGWGGGGYGEGPWSGPDIAELLQAVVNASSQAELRHFANHSTDVIRVAVAKNEHTPADVMARLSRDPSVEVRVTVASNAGTVPEFLDELSRDRSVRVRVAVAGHSEAWPHALDRLSRSKSANVRGAVATNLAAPKSVLQRLANDPDMEVCQRAATTLETVESLDNAARDFNGSRVQGGAAIAHLGNVQFQATAHVIPAEMPAAKVAKIARAVRRNPQELVSRTEVVLTAIDAFLADRMGHNLGPPLDDVKPAAGSLEAVRAALLAFRGAIAVLKATETPEPEPVVVAGRSLWDSVRGLVSTFSEEAAKSAGQEFGKWGSRAFVFLVGYMVLDMLRKAGFDLSAQSMSVAQEWLRQNIGGPS